MITPPKFWSKKSLFSILLAPLGWLYGFIVLRRLSGHKPKLSVPVLCIGNLTLGGAGKTPVVCGLADVLTRQGHVPHILTRGYGGKGWQSVQVDPKRHSAEDVGDEPLLLAGYAPTWVGKNRYESGLRAIEQGATILLMDDGLQNATVFQDVKIGVFDGTIPLINTTVFPAGPLREPFASGLKRLDLIILLNFETEPTWADSRRCFIGKTTTDQKPETSAYLAFAGIGYPEKFFNLLDQSGFTVVERISYPDHHVYSKADVDFLLTTAKKKKAQLITTEKDLVKFPKNVKKNIHSLKIRLDLNWAEIVNKALRKN